jgi:imidazolonepropionase-like amidohydrolase
MKQFIFLMMALLALPFTSAAQTRYLHCGKLVDTEAGTVKSEMTIVVDGKRVSELRTGYVQPPTGVEVIDLKNRTVLPGLIDLHVHIEWETSPSQYIEPFTLNPADIAYRAARFADRTLQAGFTTVRDLGGTGVNVSLRNAINQGLATGPRIFTAAKSIAITGGHADPTNGARMDLFDTPGPAQGVADGADACRQAVRQQVKNGADLIKITATGGVLSVARDGHRAQFTEDEIAAIVQTANDFGIHVAAHAHGDEGIRRAAAMGVTTIEHGTKMSQATMEVMKNKGTWYIPTITAGWTVADSAKIKGYYPEVVVPKALDIGPQIEKTFAKAYKNGVKIAFGTDAGVFAHGRNALEFTYMTRAGMPAMEAIQCATTRAAEVLQMQGQLGTIKPGAFADLIGVADDPTRNIATLLDVLFVMKDGAVYKKKQQ